MAGGQVPSQPAGIRPGLVHPGLRPGRVLAQLGRAAVAAAPVVTGQASGILPDSCPRKTSPRVSLQSAKYQDPRQSQAQACRDTMGLFSIMRTDFAGAACLCREMS